MGLALVVEGALFEVGAFFAATFALATVTGEGSFAGSALDGIAAIVGRRSALRESHIVADLVFRPQIFTSTGAVQTEVEPLAGIAAGSAILVVRIEVGTLVVICAVGKSGVDAFDDAGAVNTRDVGVGVSFTGTAACSTVFGVRVQVHTFVFAGLKSGFTQALPAFTDGIFATTGTIVDVGEGIAGHVGVADPAGIVAIGISRGVTDSVDFAGTAAYIRDIRATLPVVRAISAVDIGHVIPIRAQILGNDRSALGIGHVTEGVGVRRRGAGTVIDVDVGVIFGEDANFGVVAAPVVEVSALDGALLAAVVLSTPRSALYTVIVAECGVVFGFAVVFGLPCSVDTDQVAVGGTLFVAFITHGDGTGGLRGAAGGDSQHQQE